MRMGMLRQLGVQEWLSRDAKFPLDAACNPKQGVIFVRLWQL